LNDGDTFTAISSDGTGSQVVAVTINGLNDGPVFTTTTGIDFTGIDISNDAVRYLPSMSMVTAISISCQPVTLITPLPGMSMMPRSILLSLKIPLPWVILYWPLTPREI